MDQMQQCFQGIKQELMENNGNLARSLLLPAANVLNETFFQHTYDSSDSGSVATKTKHANESPEARARRLARNAQRMREKRANESYEEYKARLAKNAESNRRKRQMENEVERAMRQVKDAARQRLRRAMESPEQRTARLAKLAERMRMVRANESQEQRNIRLKRSAARARERLSRESSEERRDRLHKRAEYARKMRSVNSSDKSDDSSKTKADKITVPASKIISGSSHHNSTAGSNVASNSNLPQPHSSYPNAHHPPNVPSNASSVQEYSQSNNLVTLNNVKNGEGQFNQFPLNQNPLFIDLRSGGYLNVPTYPNPTLNMFADGLQTQVPPHLQNYVHSLSLPIHPTQLTVLPNSGSFPPAASSDHPTHHPASVIQVTPNPNNYPNSFLGQHHPPFQPQHHPPNSLAHPLQPAAVSNQHNFSNHRPPNTNQAAQNRATTPDSSSNDSMKSERIRERPRKVFPISDHDNSGVAEEMRDEAERQKLMNELLEKQINIILACPKRSRGRPSKGRESDYERRERLRKMAEGRRMKRANESSEERSVRLHNLTERARQKREFVKATETEDERKGRLARQAEYARRRRLKEQTPEAKYKADARAKELYAKLHIIKRSPDDRIIPSILSAVKLRIPNVANRDTNHKSNPLSQSNLFEPIIEMQTI